MPADDQLEVRVKALEERAERLSTYRLFARRAFVVEFAGTPKAGKSTSVEAIRHFFSRMGFKVHVLTERAAECPIPMKGHLFFNTWCLGAMLAELLENVETQTDIIIVDRGLFDTLAWLTLQKTRGEVTDDEVRRISDFILLERWRTLTDAVVLMNVAASEALNREHSTRITKRAGSVMAGEMLKQIGASVDEAARLYGEHFPGLIEVPTGGASARGTAICIAEKLVDRLEEFLDPEILVVPRAAVEALGRGDGTFIEEGVRSALTTLESAKSFVKRSSAEADDTMVQIVPCGVMTQSGKVFLFQRHKDDPKSELYGRAVLWQGCHLERGPEGALEALALVALKRKVSESLFLSREFPTKLFGYTWDSQDPRSSRHLGLIYTMEIDSDDVGVSMAKKEFRRQRGHSLQAGFRTPDELSDPLADLQLESWSRAVLQALLARRSS